MNEYDVVVVGGGAAGLSAALVLTRVHHRYAAPGAHMHGFLGSDGIPPADLLRAGREEVMGYAGELIRGQVIDIAPVGRTSPADGKMPWFDVMLEDGSTLRGRRILVTTGLRDEIPDIPGVHERWGRDVLHCPYCHGWEVRDQPLAVLGGATEAIPHAHLIRQWSSDVVFFTNGGPLTVDQREQFVARAIAVIDEPVSRLVVENDQLSGVELESGHVIRRAAVFVRPHFIPNDDLFVRLGCVTHDNGWVAVDTTGRTSVPGVWAAGNAVNPRAQVITAAGEGSAAAIAINNDLVDEDVRLAVQDFRVGLLA